MRRYDVSTLYIAHFPWLMVVCYYRYCSVIVIINMLGSTGSLRERKEKKLFSFLFLRLLLLPIGKEGCLRTLLLSTHLVFREVGLTVPLQ